MCELIFSFIFLSILISLGMYYIYLSFNMPNSDDYFTILVFVVIDIIIIISIFIYLYTMIRIIYQCKKWWKKKSEVMPSRERPTNVEIV